MKDRRHAWAGALAGLALAGLSIAASAVAAMRSAVVPSSVPVTTPRAAGFSTEGLERLASFMRRSTTSPGYLGAVTLIARDGAIVDWRAYGHRDIARRQPMKKDAIFRVYSMTKTVATVAALMLVDEGKLALDAPIAEHLPEFADTQVLVGGTADAPVLRPAATAITLRHLLTHTAGFATGAPGTEEATRLLARADLHGAADLADFGRRAARVPLGIDPGRSFRYDGTNTEIAARLVEAASGMRFARFVKERILDPLGMRDTGFSVPVERRSRIADLSTPGPDGLVLHDSPSAQHPGERLQRYDSGAGGLYTTATDYLRLCTMLLDGGRFGGRMLLQPATVQSMMHDQLPADVMPGDQLLGGERFGFGGSVVIDPPRRGRAGSVGAFGWSGAASTYYTIDPSRRVIAILLMQHLPLESAEDPNARNLPKISATFYDLVYQSLDR